MSATLVTSSDSPHVDAQIFSAVDAMNDESAIKKSKPRAIQPVQGGESASKKLSFLSSTIDFILYLIARALYLVISLLPLKILVVLIHSIVRLVMWCKPAYIRYAEKNLAIVFPGDEAKQKRLITESIESFSWLIVDTLRAPQLNKRWLSEHIKVTGEGIDGLRKALLKSDGKGAFVLTGHLSSYELIAVLCPQYEIPMLAIMRPFKNKYINEWVIRSREVGGSKVCLHRNSFFEILRALKKGTTVGFLFDQNVTRNYAFFVDWFGVPAATTKGLGFAAVSTKCPIVITTMRRVGFDKYELDYEEVPTSDVYVNEVLSDQDKALEVTKRAVKIFEQCILRDPGAWFWMHRRWKTRPEGEPETFYK